jgi:hypothetical protein
MLSGVENCRIRFREKETTSSHITMYVQMNDLSGVSEKDFINKAIAVANAVKELEKKGTRVELFGYYYSRYIDNSRLKTLIILPIKKASATLSLGQLYGVFAPSTFRRLIFRHLELFSTLADPEGYGASEDWSDAPNDSKTVVIHRGSHFNKLTTAIEYINNRVSEKIK